MVQRLSGGPGWPAVTPRRHATAWSPSAAAAVGPDQTVLATGTNVAEADLDGRFRWVTGFWDPPPHRPEPAERS